MEESVRTETPIEKFDRIWNGGVTEHGHTKTYSTREVAEILGLNGSQAVSYLIRRRKMFAKRYRKGHWRRTLLRITPKALARYMVKTGLSPEILVEVDDPVKNFLRRQTLDWMSVFLALAHKK